MTHFWYCCEICGGSVDELKVKKYVFSTFLFCETFFMFYSSEVLINSKWSTGDILLGGYYLDRLMDRTLLAREYRLFFFFQLCFRVLGLVFFMMFVESTAWQLGNARILHLRALPSQSLRGRPSHGRTMVEELIVL